MNSTRPYLIRAIYEWCSDSDLTPYISVNVDSNMDVPEEHVKNGEIVLNISHKAVQNLIIDNNLIQFMARFNGAEKKMHIPINAVKGIFAKEVNQGLAFSNDIEEPSEHDTIGTAAESDKKCPTAGIKKDLPSPDGKPNLRIVK